METDSFFARFCVLSWLLIQEGATYRFKYTHNRDRVYDIYTVSSTCDMKEIVLFLLMYNISTKKFDKYP